MGHVGGTRMAGPCMSEDVFWEKRVGTEGAGIALGEDGGSLSPPWEMIGLAPTPQPVSRAGSSSCRWRRREGGRHRPVQSRLWVLTWTPGSTLRFCHVSISVQSPHLQPSHPCFLATPNFTSSMTFCVPLCLAQRRRSIQTC